MGSEFHSILDRLEPRIKPEQLIANTLRDAKTVQMLAQLSPQALTGFVAPSSRMAGSVTRIALKTSIVNSF